MVDAIVSAVLEQLISMAVEEAKEEVRLVGGVDQEVEKLASNLRAIQAEMVDAEQRQIKEESFRLWLDQLKHTSYDMEDVLDEWNNARLKLQIEGVHENAVVPQKKVCSFPTTSCFGFQQVFLRRDIALKIRAINAKLDDIAKQKDMFNFNVNRSIQKAERIQSTSLIDVSEVRGREIEKNTLKSKLLCENIEEQNAVQIISMVGMGGIGKTTLAQFAYNDNDVLKNFEVRIWVCVSDPFDEFRVAKAIMEALEGSTPNLGELNSLMQCIQASIVGKKFFLILDDVWTEDYNKWELFHRCLRNGRRGSKILVTTRNETVARMMESTCIISVREMSEQECWLLFKRSAFFGRSPSNCEQLEEIGRKIVGRCKGLPLAAKIMGNLLRFKRTREEWQNILESEMWQLEEFEKGLLAPLLLSYNDLPPMIKHCFTYCALFPKDYNMDKDELIKLWMAQGYIEPKDNKDLEMIGGECFDYLATRSLFQEFVKDEEDIVKGCKMHDIVHDFSLYLTKNECAALEVDGCEEPLSLINTCQEKLRHSMLVLGQEASFPVSLFNAKKLRSLLIQGPFEVFPPSLARSFDQFTCLRTLIIENIFYGRPICEIPSEIKKLIHLRYFKLVQLEIQELPETCCDLFNLQTLEIEKCERLERLPEGIGKLVNLRHLKLVDVYLDYMPKAIERLNSLRTLSHLVVGSGKYGSKACNLESLRHLNQIRGSLTIRRLGNVTDVEARNAHLDKKKNLVRLELWYDKDFEEEEDENSEARSVLLYQEKEEVQEEKAKHDHEAISEALRPPPSLEALKIFCYEGKTVLLDWIESLSKLKFLSLHCSKCEILPPLGKLPSLQVLKILNMTSVKRVGDEFLGIKSCDIHGTSSSSASSVIAFPKLKCLTLRRFGIFEEWDFGKEDNITVMPQLNSLDILSCSRLKSLPDQLIRNTSLEKLEIRFCEILEERFRKDTGDDWSKISHIPNIKFYNQYVQGGPQ